MQARNSRSTRQRDFPFGVSVQGKLPAPAGVIAVPPDDRTRRRDCKDSSGQHLTNAADIAYSKPKTDPAADSQESQRLNNRTGENESDQVRNHNAPLRSQWLL